MTTEAHQIVDVIAKIVPDDGAALAQSEGTQALVQAQALEHVVQDLMNNDPAYHSMWQQFQADPRMNAPILVGIIQVIYQNDPIVAQELDMLLAAYQQVARSSVKGKTTTIATGGGAYIGGAVQLGAGAQFAGRDQIVIAQNPKEIAHAFQGFYRQVAEHSDLTVTDKADVKADLEEIEGELAKGAKANESMIHRRLRNIQRMAPDILDVVLTTFANPVAGLGMAAKKIAEKMKSEAEEKTKE